MFSEDLARDVQGAELMVTQHSELKAEIDTKEEKYVIIIANRYSPIYTRPLIRLESGLNGF